MPPDKGSIRRLMIARRKSLPDEQVVGKSRAIGLKLLQAIDWQSIKTVNIYKSNSMLKEVDTKLIIAAVISGYPHIELSLMPGGKSGKSPDGSFDLIIVPVLGFDERCFRLGMGGGFYDRFLAGQPKALKVGLAYQEGRLEQHINWGEHDIPMDMIITESIIVRRDSITDKNQSYQG